MNFEVSIAHHFFWINGSLVAFFNLVFVSLCARAEGHLMQSYRDSLQDGYSAHRLFGRLESCSVHYDIGIQKW
jgi:hypothetical protein